MPFYISLYFLVSILYTWLTIDVKDFYFAQVKPG